ncbi:hypothetical protein EV649_0694 [Kribbella sp. VKM Ac-2569]|uniref:hypothetical protein n=1 Tax=Kribbella sp. VKM Ac-2569 TaxID=2512220 RepID=UPI00102CA372|nr:hypothetical protein [Kribbella sp. VKM Ac-2569]RZT26946.1 hypothetical protein EV649_0694 [Kribbella sp. VKM Ac-2569]
MTAQRLDLRRPPTRPAAGNLFRVTAAVSFLSIPLLWVAYLVVPPEEIPCQDHACPPSVDVVRRTVEPWVVVVAAAGAELVVIACYLVLAAARGTLDLRTGLRWSPTAVAIVALSVGSFGWLMDNGAGLSFDAAELTFLLLLAAWLLTPLVLYAVHRGDRRAVLPVVVGLAPTALGNAVLIANDPLVAPMGLPAIMLVVGVITVLVVRRRR